jgi:DNA integrity scanning protein DisA with diadenylate cyclase activity
MNNASKITVPQAVANAIAHYVALADSKHEAFTDILSLGYEAEKSELILRHFAHDFDELMEALICGYEVAEETYEERLLSRINYEMQSLAKSRRAYAL